MEFTSSQRTLSQPITCQNCGQILSENDRSALEQAMSAVYGLPSETETASGVIEEYEGFKFALEVTPHYFDFGVPDVL